MRADKDLLPDFSPLLAHIRRQVPLSAADEAHILQRVKLLKLRKRQYLSQPGYVCHYQSYVVRGALRSYLLDRDGQAHTIQFAVEDWWVTDFASFIHGTPGTLFIEALEETVVIQWHRDAIQELYTLIPALERFFRIMGERALIAAQQRLLSNLSLSVAERYDAFMDKYPDIAQRVPQYALASFLGCSTEFLSRLRAGKGRKS